MPFFPQFSNLFVAPFVPSAFSPADIAGLSLWLKADAGLTTSTVTPTYISQIVISGAGQSTSNGTYVRTSGGNTAFTSGSNRIEKLVSTGDWYLYDATLDDYAYVNYEALDQNSWEQEVAYGAPSAVNTTSSGTPYAGVTAWADQSGNARTVTVTNSPALTASSINSRPTVDFDGATQFVDALTPAFVGNNNFSVIWAFKYVGDSTAGNSYSPSVSFLSNSSLDLGAFHYIKNQSKRPASYPLANGGWTPYDYSSGFTYSDGSNFILEFVSDNNLGDYVVNRNNTQEGTASVSATASSDVTGIRIAGQQSPVRYANIRMAEIMVYNSTLTSTQLGQVRGYLNTKYAIY